MARKAFILIVSGQRERRDRLRELLRDRYGHAVSDTATVDEGLESIRQRAPDVVVTEPRVGDAPAAQPLSDALDALNRDATLVLLGEAPDELGVESIRVTSVGAGDEPEAIAARISQIASQAAARRDDRLLQQSAEQTAIEQFEGIVGDSPVIQRIVERIRKAAKNKLTVLIIGETGTGKELIADAIHRRSDRANRPFKAVNCAGLNDNLLESELFGHVRGAFTGAVADRKGYFVAADGGTLFLDEIGDMPLAMQAKLLRALERREVNPVGSTETRKVDVRIIAATNIDLKRSVDEKRFREDLFYRLHEWEIRVPPLRERKSDIPALAHHLLKRANERNGLSVPGFSSEAMQALTRYYWPGNVRELANAIQAAAANAEDRAIELDDLWEDIRGSREIVPASGAALVGLTFAQMERLLIERTLMATNGNREQAAKMLGIGTRTLYRKLKEYGLG